MGWGDDHVEILQHDKNEENFGNLLRMNGKDF